MCELEAKEASDRDRDQTDRVAALAEPTGVVRKAKDPAQEK